MIIFELGCTQHHRFEGWFASAEDFNAQRDRQLLQCPVCGTSDVARIPHAKISVSEPSHVSSDAGRTAGVTPDVAPTQPTPQQRFQAVATFVQQVMAQTEDVGREFAEEARRIHYEEVPRRAIRGVASLQETRELLDEGITVLPLPVPPKDDWN